MTNKNENERIVKTLINNGDHEGYEIEIIAESEVSTVSGKSAKTGNPYSFHKQEAYLHQGSGYPVLITVPIDDPLKPYEVGFYYIANALSVGAFGDLTINRNFFLVKHEDRD